MSLSANVRRKVRPLRAGGFAFRPGDRVPAANPSLGAVDSTRSPGAPFGHVVAILSDGSSPAGHLNIRYVVQLASGARTVIR